MVHIPYRSNTGALHLLIDITGVKADGDGEWLARKHEPSKPRHWRKVHLGIDAATLEIRAIHCPAGDLHGKSAERGDHLQPGWRRAGSD